MLISGDAFAPLPSTPPQVLGTSIHPHATDLSQQPVKAAQTKLLLFNSGRWLIPQAQRVQERMLPSISAASSTGVSGV